MQWKRIKSRRDIPREGLYIVTRTWSKSDPTVELSMIYKYKNKKYWVAPMPVGMLPRNAYAFDNVVAYMELPLPFTED